MKKVSVIILNWNGSRKNLLQHYLPSVIENTAAELSDIIVADNGSDDDSIQLIERDFPTVKIIDLHENLGFAEGYNQAIAQVDTPYVLLLNDDVRVTPHWLEPLVNFLESNPQTVGVQPKILSDRDPSRFEYAGAAGGFLDRNFFPYCRGRIFDFCETDQGQYDNPVPVMWATGACLLLRRNEYIIAGGLDKHFFAHMEEIDLCWRLRNMGYTLACIGHSMVYHLGGGSLAMGDPKKTLLNFRNSLLMMYKNLPPHKRKWAIFKRKMYDGVAALNYILHGQFNQVQAIWKAHRQYTKMLDEIYKAQSHPDHNYNQNIGYNRNNNFIDNNKFKEHDLNIIIAHYLLGRKTYQDLKQYSHVK